MRYTRLRLDNIIYGLRTSTLAFLIRTPQSDSASTDLEQGIRVSNDGALRDRAHPSIVVRKLEGNIAPENAVSRDEIPLMAAITTSLNHDHILHNCSRQCRGRMPPSPLCLTPPALLPFKAKSLNPHLSILGVACLRNESMCM